MLNGKTGQRLYDEQDLETDTFEEMFQKEVKRQLEQKIKQVDENLASHQLEESIQPPAASSSQRPVGVARLSKSSKGSGAGVHQSENSDQRDGFQFEKNLPYEQEPESQ